MDLRKLNFKQFNQDELKRIKASFAPQCQPMALPPSKNGLVWCYDTCRWIGEHS